MTDGIDRALHCFQEGFNCAQAVVAAYGPEFGLTRDDALRTAAAFGGGVAAMGETCGAVSGALMVIGLARGMTDAKDKEAKKRTYGTAQEFIERFKARHFTLLCRELLGCEVGTPEGMKFMKENDLHTRLCAVFVKDAAEIIEELLFQTPSRAGRTHPE